MNVRTPCLVLVLALAACASPGAPTKGSSTAAAAAAGGEEPLPGVSLEGLSPEQRALVVAFASEQFCYCGCPHTLATCLREHRTCRHAPRMLALAVRLVRADAKKDEVERVVAAYYASFDRRAKLDVAEFGPPLGNASAPVTLVEFSDFTCPYCMLVRPTLEAFVQARADRVKLVYKPFPIDSHPGAYDAAQAGEWARANGLFWPMHDALFGNPQARSPDDLADLARSVGGDPADLRAALADQRYLPKIKASQAEARTAGIRGTPTLFLDGRRLDLSDFSEEGLETTLQDEEEWLRHQGWERD